ncbi:MAG: hypothetical protein U0872_07185 [Planctomycetaceae bacterium]
MSEQRVSAVTLCTILLAMVAAPAGLYGEDAKSSANDVIIVIGAAGTEEYGSLFQSWGARWTAAAQRGNAAVTFIGRDQTGEQPDRERMQQALSDAAGEMEKPLWLVLIGHGTFDRKTARFNLRGPDFSASDLAEWLRPLARPVAVIDCSASSAPFLTALSAPGRIVITATKTGGEENFTRFGEFLATAVGDPEADLDKDDQTSLWEAYLGAARRTAEFYAADGRLQTEHALLDDNGDKQGTRGDIFQGLKLKDDVETADAVDGNLAHQWHLIPSARDAQVPPDVRRRRDELELKILELRQRKSGLEEDDYFHQLEMLLLELSRLNQQASIPST